MLNIIYIINILYSTIDTKTFCSFFQNGCFWLMKSEPTDSFDILESGLSQWYMWDGSVQPGINVVVKCNDCGAPGDKESCNYNGECALTTRCNCDFGYYGTHCEFKSPCNEIECECLIYYPKIGSRCLRMFVLIITPEPQHYS